MQKVKTDILLQEKMGEMTKILWKLCNRGCYLLMVRLLTLFHWSGYDNMHCVSRNSCLNSFDKQLNKLQYTFVGTYITKQ